MLITKNVVRDEVQVDIRSLYGRKSAPPKEAPSIAAFHKVHVCRMNVEVQKPITWPKCLVFRFFLGSIAAFIGHICSPAAHLIVPQIYRVRFQVFLTGPLVPPVSSRTLCLTKRLQKQAVWLPMGLGQIPAVLVHFHAHQMYRPQVAVCVGS